MRRGLKWLVICMWFMLENIWRHKWHFIWPFSSLLVLNHECEVLLPSSAPHFTLKPEVRGGGKIKKKDMKYHQPRGATADYWSESAQNSSDHYSVSRTTADGPALLQRWLSILSLGARVTRRRAIKHAAGDLLDFTRFEPGQYLSRLPIQGCEGGRVVSCELMPAWKLISSSLLQCHLLIYRQLQGSTVPPLFFVKLLY